MKTSKNLKALLNIAQNITMSDEDMECRRKSFAYGNGHLHNPNITREMIDKAAEYLKNKRSA